MNKKHTLQQYGFFRPWQGDKSKNKTNVITSYSIAPQHLKSHNIKYYNRPQ